MLGIVRAECYILKLKVSFIFNGFVYFAKLQLIT